MEVFYDHIFETMVGRFRLYRFGTLVIYLGREVDEGEVIDYMFEIEIDKTNNNSFEKLYTNDYDICLKRLNTDRALRIDATERFFMWVDSIQPPKP